MALGSTRGAAQRDVVAPAARPRGHRGRASLTAQGVRDASQTLTDASAIDGQKRTVADLAAALSVARPTLYLHAKHDPSLREALDLARERLEVARERLVVAPTIAAQARRNGHTQAQAAAAAGMSVEGLRLRAKSAPDSAFAKEWVGKRKPAD